MLRERTLRPRLHVLGEAIADDPQTDAEPAEITGERHQPGVDSLKRRGFLARALLARMPDAVCWHTNAQEPADLGQGVSE